MRPNLDANAPNGRAVVICSNTNEANTPALVICPNTNNPLRHLTPAIKVHWETAYYEGLAANQLYIIFGDRNIQLIDGEAIVCYIWRQKYTIN